MKPDLSFRYEPLLANRNLGHTDFLFPTGLITSSGKAGVMFVVSVIPFQNWVY